MNSIKAAAALLVLVTLAGAVPADTIAYVVPEGTAGNQAYTGSLGMDFDVNSDIVITQLGVFDDNSDGLQAPLQARLYERDDLLGCAKALLATVDFPVDDPGTLIGGSRFKPLPNPITLPAGFLGSIVASGYGSAEMNGNGFGSAVPWTTDDGGSLITFAHLGRFDKNSNPGAYPTARDGGPPNRYAAGTFMFHAAPGGEAALPPIGEPGCESFEKYRAVPH